MKLIYGILLFFSVACIGVELSNHKYYKRIQVQQEADRHFVRDTMYYLSESPSGTDKGCGSCYYYFTGVLKHNKDTVSVMGQHHIYTRLLQVEKGKQKKLFFDVWYSKYLKITAIIKSNDANKYKPGVYDSCFLVAWVAYFFMFCSIPLLILLIKKDNED